ncbi:MAG: helix-turn-helix transcriptional regulator [Candidatus Melainabacteria bacterium]|nr:helix-turn-helix transcriptional regulator [Candidatus Melainabacteria bacterium]
MSSTSKDSPRSCCPITNVLDIVGDRWTLLVVRDLLLLGKHEYKDFMASPESIATNVLADRLKRLSCAGIIDEIAYPTNKSRKIYYLTGKGKALLPMLVEMILWGGNYLSEVEIPKQKFRQIKKDPEAFKKGVLESIAEWERTVLRPLQKVAAPLDE